MEENKYNLDNTKNCISDGNNTLIITYDKDDVLHPRKDQYNHCHLIPLTSRLRTDLDDIESITDALKNLIADAHLDCGVLGLEEDDIEHKPEWCFNEILKAYNKELEDGEIQNSTFNQLVICPLWLYKHSGVSLNTYRQDRWDSSFVGIAYITKEEAQEMMMDKDAYNMHEELVTFFEKNIQWELNKLNQYFNGEVYAGYLYQKNQLVQDEHDLYFPSLNATKKYFLDNLIDPNLSGGKIFDTDNLREFNETMDIDEFDINTFKYENYGQNEIRNFKEPYNNINYKNLGNKNHSNKNKEEKGQEK